jgi:hypothetical protein
MGHIVALPVDRAIDVSGVAQAITSSCRLTHGISRPTAVCLHVNQRGLLKPKSTRNHIPSDCGMIALHLVRIRPSQRKN